jgi:adenosylcobinamide-phosphate synthase
MTAAAFSPGELSILGGALLIDVTLGEWPRAVHPVVWMGKMTSLLERQAPRSGARRQLVAGVLMAAIVPMTFATASAAALAGLRDQIWLEAAAGVVLLKSTFALSALAHAATAVERALERNSVDDARFGLTSLCSRDPSRLGPSELCAATIESVAENASDSFVAPLFYYALLGVPGAIAYRAVNTLDAMIGYHGRYEYLGKASARLDDLLNWVPARLTALLLVAAAWLGGERAGRGWSILRRDGAATESPNAGRPMAAMAGILGVELAKAGHYRLGDPLEPLSPAKIRDARRMLRIAAALGVGVVFLVMGARNIHVV